MAAAGIHVAVCPVPLSSHPISYLRLSRKLAATAPEIVISLFVTEPSAMALSASLTPEEVAAGSIRIRPVEVGEINQADSGHRLAAMRAFVGVAKVSLRKAMDAAVDETGVKITCLVTDGFLAYACREIAEELGVKWVVMWTSAAAGLAANLHSHVLRTRIQTQEIEAHAEKSVDEYIPGFPADIRIADLPREVVAADDANPVAQMLRSMYLHLPKATAIAVNSFHHLEPAAISTLTNMFGDKLFPSGPYALTVQPTTGTIQDPHGCLPWLDTQRPTSVVYISFGSAYNPPLEEFASLAEALEATKVPFLWSLPDRLKSCLPQDFNKCGRGKVVPWTPQPSVLRHVAMGAFLTHCGWNSVMDSVVGGVPIICRPLEMADQVFNKRMVETLWGIGVGVDGGRLTKEAVEKAVEMVVFGEEGRRMREKIQVMKGLALEVAAPPDGVSVQNVRKFISIVTT